MADIMDVLGHPLFHFGAEAVSLGSMITAVVILGAALLLARTSQRAVSGLLARRQVSPGAQAAAGKIARYLVGTIGAVVALSSLGLNLTALIAASSILLVGLGFGLQNVAQNFVSGLILLVEQPIREGDFVRVGDTLGLVRDIGLRATRVVTRDQVAIIVPNSELVSSPVVNHSRPTTELRFGVNVGVAYGSDVELVRSTLLGVAAAHPSVLAEPAPEVRFLDFGESSLDFTLLVWIADPQEDLRVGSDLRFAIDAAFRRSGITIPFPQRDLHVVSGLERLGGAAEPEARS
jgi:small-conductance mechanosensitive channel